MRKDIGVKVITAFAILVVIAAALYLILPSFTRQTIELKIGDGVFRSSVALNNDDRTKGLSGESKLNTDQALLMVFPTPSRWEIWMKDMKVPIDILWLNSDKRVIYIKENASPSDQTTIYKSGALAKYVVELPAGTVNIKSIQIGSLATFEVDESKVE